MGPAIDFAPNSNAFANWSINNNQGGIGRKQGFLIDLVGNGSLGTSVQNTDVLIAVLEIPIIASPGQAQILITATPTGVVAGGNTYTWDDGVRVNDEGERIQIVEDFTLPAMPAQLNIFDPVDCAGATTNSSIDWADPNDGGTGGQVVFNFPGTTNADQVHVVGNDGYDNTVASGGSSTSLTIDTDPDGSPDPDFDVSYSATYQVEFPPMSGTFIDGAACVLTPPWSATTAAMVWDPTPVIGMSTTLDITLTNARWDGARYGNLTGPNGVNVDLTVPTSGAGTNVLVFADALTINPIDNTHVGNYTVTGIGPGTNTYSETIVLTLEPPVNQTVCANITEASIEGSVTIPLAGNDGAVDFTVIYDGTTYDNLPEGDFVLSNIVGDVTDVITRANGFDSGGNPIFDEVVCDLNYALPTCVSSQDPPGTVDVGTVITLFLDTTNAIAATVEGSPMTPDVDPDDNFNVQWSAAHVAVADTILTGTVTNSDGETSTCTWTIDINCIDPSIVSVARVGEVGITIHGTFDCEYTVRITEHSSGTSTDYDVLIDVLTIPSLNEGEGTLDVVVPPDSWIEVGQVGFPSATDMVPTVPTLGEWGLIAFIALLMGAGVLFMRKRSVV
jgi:hypothetical protein